PIVHAPAGLSPLPAESFGEVQTPFSLAASAPALGLGDPIVCRHAKAGELFERFDRVHLVDLARATTLAPAETYRGLGVTDG
ncbi:MAG TPA: amino acid deaminase/aldolase, partial [Myxococcota bacterium]|nr:amino acid deaminase/aldolase [Myxococcota bacterium]